MNIITKLFKKEKTITISYNKENLPYVEKIKNITSKKDIAKAMRVLETLQEFEPETEIKRFSVDNRPTQFTAKKTKPCINIPL